MTDMDTLETIVQQAVQCNASDIHFHAGTQLRFRVDGKLVKANKEVLTFQDCEEYGRQLCPEAFDTMKTIGEIDGSTSVGTARIRYNLYRSKGNCSIALRILHAKIPALSSLGLPPAVKEFSSYNKGIVLVTGETGSGKSTTLASILDEINHTRYEHIITLEDPIEYIHEPDLCLIDQREVGSDTRTYGDGLKAVLREDPDILLLGELRDAETIETALTAAETGHLVFATLHTNTAVDTIDRLISAFDASKHTQIRTQLAQTLRAVVCQQLLVRKGGKGRVAACEVMIVNAALKNQIREGNTASMVSSLVAGKNIGSVSMDNCLIGLVRSGVIDSVTALEAAQRKDYIEQNVSMGMRSRMR